MGNSCGVLIPAVSWCFASTQSLHPCVERRGSRDVLKLGANTLQLYVQESYDWDKKKKRKCAQLGFNQVILLRLWPYDLGLTGCQSCKNLHQPLWQQPISVQEKSLHCVQQVHCVSHVHRSNWRSKLHWCDCWDSVALTRTKRMFCY